MPEFDAGAITEDDELAGVERVFCPRCGAVTEVREDTWYCGHTFAGARPVQCSAEVSLHSPGRKTLRIKAESVERFIDAKPEGNWR